MENRMKQNACSAGLPIPSNAVRDVSRVGAENSGHEQALLRCKSLHAAHPNAKIFQRGAELPEIVAVRKENWDFPATDVALARLLGPSGKSDHRRL